MSTEVWKTRLQRVAEPALPREVVAPGCGAAKFMEEFADGAGHRRLVDRPFLSHLLRLGLGAAPDHADGDVMAWWAVHQPGLIERTRIDWESDGRLFPWLRDTGVEWWTEAEMCALHALSWIGLAEGSGRVRERAKRCAAWLMAEVQPDNATQRPWAVHVFVAESLDGGNSPSVRDEASMYAQTLLQNAIVGREAPDRFSACILWDAAAWLGRGGGAR